MDRLKKIFLKQEGFTLLELMISLAILSIGMLGIVGMYVYAIDGNAQGRNTSKAISLAATQIEELKLTPYANLTSNSIGVTSGIFKTRYWTQKTISELEMRKSTISVTWSSKGLNHEVTLKSMIPKQ